jgi:hypothetical protein
MRGLQSACSKTSVRHAISATAEKERLAPGQRAEHNYQVGRHFANLPSAGEQPQQRERRLLASPSELLASPSELLASPSELLASPTLSAMACRTKGKLRLDFANSSIASHPATCGTFRDGEVRALLALQLIAVSLIQSNRPLSPLSAH